MTAKKEPFKVGDIIYDYNGTPYKIFGLCEGLMAIQKTQGRKDWQLNLSFPLDWTARTKGGWFKKM